MEEFNDIPMVSQPRNLKIKLFNHQLASIYQMERLERDRVVDCESGFKETTLGIYADPIGYGKCLGLDTEIIMYNGDIKKVQDVRVGDLIMGDDSLPREVLSLARGIDDMYLIKQRHGGIDYRVNKEHILCLRVLNTKNITFDSGLYQVKFFIPELRTYSLKMFNLKDKAHEFYNKLNIDPYITITISDYLKLPQHIKDNLYGYRVGVEFLCKEILEDPYIIGNSQRIPYEYIANTRTIRTKVLAGLLDSLSMASANTWYVIDKSLNNIVTFLSRSLGLCVEHGGGGKIRLTGNFGDIMTKQHTVISTYTDNCSEIEIIPEGEGDYYGFSISGNRKFLLGDFTVTHNTLSVVGLLSRDLMEWDLEMPFIKEFIHPESNGLVTKHIIRRFNRLPTTLILVSSAILAQWLKELSFSDLKVASVTNKKEIDSVKAEDFDVVVVLSSTYNDYIRSYSNFAWKRFIFDEPSSIRIPRMKDIIAGFNWFVTATPNDMKSLYQHSRHGFMRNIVGDMWNNSMEEQYKEIIVRNNIEFVKRSFNMPAINHIYHKCYETLIHALRGVIDEDVMSLINAGDIDGAITVLGGCKVTNVIELVKEKKQTEMRRLMLHRSIHILTEEQLVSLEERINNLKRQIETIETRYEEILQNNNCNICLDKFKHPVMETNCQNIFCTDCMIRWVAKIPTCPLCKSYIDKNSLIYIKTDSDINATEHTQPKTVTKIQKILELIQANPTSKFLILSAVCSTFIPICRLLSENNIPFVQIKGSQQVRQKKINNFKSGNARVIFLESMYDSSGLNLHEATDIIFYHKISKDIEDQIIGRVMRIGQTNPLNVHHLQA